MKTTTVTFRDRKKQQSIIFRDENVHPTMLIIQKGDHVHVDDGVLIDIHGEVKEKMFEIELKDKISICYVI